MASSGVRTGEELVGLRELDAAEWIDLQRDSSAAYPMSQCYPYAEVMSSLGRPASFLVVRQQHRLIGGLLLVRFGTGVRTVWRALGGPLCREGCEDRVGPALAKGILRLRRRSMGVRWKVTPDRVWNLEARGLHPSEIRRNTSLIDLKRSEESLWRDIDRKQRGTIKTAERRGIRVEQPTTAEGWRTSFDLEQRQSAERGYEPEYDLPMWTRFREVLAPAAQVVVFNAYLGPEATGTLVMFTNSTRWAALGVLASPPGKGRDGSASALLWQAIRWAKTSGYTTFDMGGIPPPESALAGIGAFKLSFGGKLVPLEEYIEGRLIRILSDLPGTVRLHVRPQHARRIDRRIHAIRELARTIGGK